jgi:hypothetical protein
MSEKSGFPMESPSCGEAVATFFCPSPALITFARLINVTTTIVHPPLHLESSPTDR